MGDLATPRCHLAPSGEGFVASTASVVGAVHLGRLASIWYGAVLRGDDDAIHVGDRSNVQDNCVIHPLPGSPTRIGSEVTVGHGAILHMKSIGERCLIGMGAILLGEAEIGPESIIGAGALVLEGTVIPPRSLVVGSPGRVIRAVTDEEVAFVLSASREYLEKTERHRI